jgi:hypothetical protein
MIIIRSYRRVFDVDHRVRKIGNDLRVDEYVPDGIPLLGITYFFAALATIYALLHLPIVGPILGLLPWFILYLAIPMGVGYAGVQVRPDGLAAHRFALNWVRYQTQPKRRVNGQRVPVVGYRVRPRASVRFTRSRCEHCE